MGRRIIAVTDIVSDTFKIVSGEVLDVTKFNRDQLKELHNLGAIRIEEFTELSVEEGSKTLEEVQLPKNLEKTDAPKNLEEPKTPETLKTNVDPVKSSTVKTTVPPVGRLTKDNISIEGKRPSNVEDGKSDGASDTK